jgi:multidrug resistance efflux pump
VKKFIRLSLLVALGILLFLPYPYRPGGVIKISPPTQQQIQAQVKGKITKVFFEGGDGQWIKAGTVIANLEAVDIENSVLITQEQVRQQQAELEKQQANLKKLLATPRKEDVEVAKQQVEVDKQQVEVAKQQVEVAQEQLKTAIGKAEFSSRQAERYKALYNTGAFSLQQYENSAKDAETDRSNVEEAKQNVEEAKQNVEKKRQDIKKAEANLASVLSGPFPEEIEAARKEVEAARANLKRFQQQLKYNQDQVKRTPLVMPIDGYLVTSSLNQKVGSYLEQGETFAVAEDNRHIRGEVEVPEYDIGDFSVGRKVEVKLLAYPDKPLTGEVVSVEPIAASDSTKLTNADESTSSLTEQFVKVTVDLPNTDRLLKAGMSGYAKIEGRTMPVFAAFTRSIVRFVQVEIWSWLP